MFSKNLNVPFLPVAPSMCRLTGSMGMSLSQGKPFCLERKEVFEGNSVYFSSGYGTSQRQVHNLSPL